MADVDMGAAIARIDARIDKLRAERRVMLKLHRSNGAAVERKSRTAAPRKITKQEQLVAIVRQTKNGWVRGELVEHAAEQLESTVGSVRVMLNLLRRKGRLRDKDGVISVARQRAA